MALYATESARTRPGAPGWHTRDTEGAESVSLRYSAVQDDARSAGPALQGLRPVVGVAQLADTLAGEADRFDDLDLGHSAVGGFPDRGNEGVVGCVAAGGGALVGAGERAESIPVHDSTISCANSID